MLFVFRVIGIISANNRVDFVIGVVEIRWISAYDFYMFISFTFFIRYIVLYV